MPDNINEKIKEQYDHDNSGGSLNTNLGDFLDSESASGDSINTQWRNWAEGTGTSLNTRLFNKHGGSGSFMTRWKNWVAFSSTHSFNFDGSNDYLELSESVTLSGDFTVSMWIKPDGLSNEGLCGSIANDFYAFRINDADTVRIYFGAVGSQDFDPGFTFTIGEWQHIALVRDSSNVCTVYRNGSAGGTTQSLAGNFVISVIGAYYTSKFDGAIDEVGFYDTELSASDITSIYNNGKVIDLSNSTAYAVDRTANLKLWLRCGDKAEPESTTSIARQDFYTDFDGSNDYVDVSDDSSLDLSGTGYYSIFAWVKADVDIASDTFTIANKYSTNAGWILGVTTTNNLRWETGDGSAIDTTKSANNSYPETVGLWQHIGVTGGGGGKAKLYLNGNELGSLVTDDNHDTIATNTADMLIGTAPGGSAGFWNGAISNLSIYQTALDAQTISQMAKSRFTPTRDNRFSVVNLDGTNEYIDCGNDSSLALTGAFTISVWFNINSISNVAGATVLSKGDSGSDRAVVLQAFRLDASGGIKFALFLSSDGSNWAVSGLDTGYGTISTGTWHHVVATWNGSTTGKIYLDGVLKDTDTVSSFTTRTTSSNVRIGINSDNGSDFNGDIKSVSVYNEVKSDDEAYAIYQQGITYDESSLSGLVGYWRMGDDTSKAYPTIADSSSNSNDGTITNGASDDIVQQMVAGYDMGAFESSSEELGGEIVNDPTFSTDLANGGTNANFKLSGAGEITGGAWSFTATGVVGYNTIMVDASTEATFSSSKLYKLVFTISSSGNALIHWDWASSGYENYANGEHTVYALGDGGNLQLRASGHGATFSMTALSIKPVLQSADLSDTYYTLVDVNEPVLGVELVANGTMEADSNWSNYNSPTTNERSSEQAHSGTYSRKFTTDANYEGIISDGYTTTTGNHYIVSFWVYPASITSIRVRMQEGDGSGDIATSSTTNPTFSGLTLNAWNQVSFNYQESSGGSSGKIVMESGGNTGSNSATYYIDDVTVKELQGNAGKMTNQALSDLVYSSVLPDQSFLTGVNSAYNFIDLDGSDEYIQLTGKSPSSSFTLSTWIKLASDSGYTVIYNQWSSTDIWWGINNDDNFMRLHLSGSSNRIDTADDSITYNTWLHLACTWDGSNAKLYINGVQQSTSVSGTLATPSAQDNPVVGIASTDKVSNALNASIGSLANYNESKSATDISAMYALGRHGNLLDSYADNLVGYWAMSSLDSVTGLSDSISTIYDRSGNSNHGTPTNAESADLKSSPNAEPNGYAKGDTNRSTTTP
jgi:hypothetical protein